MMAELSENFSLQMGDRVLVSSFLGLPRVSVLALVCTIMNNIYKYRINTHLSPYIITGLLHIKGPIHHLPKINVCPIQSSLKIGPRMGKGTGGGNQFSRLYNRYKTQKLINMLITQIVLTFLLCLVQEFQAALFQVTSQTNSISNIYTLVNNVQYDLNFSMTNESIAAGSTVGLKFSERYFITNSTLTGCRATTSSASNPATMPCSVIYYSGSQVYEVTMTGIFATTTTYSFLRLAFVINNPYAEVSEPINVTIYTSGVMVGYGTAYISNYKASVMTGCSVQSASMLTYANATHTYTFTPPQRLLVNSYLLIEMPVWSSSTLANQVTAFLICTGLQGTDSASLSCSMQSPITTQTLNITTGLISMNRSSSTIQISVADLRNPWSLQPFGPISLQLMYGSYLTQVCYNVYNTVTTPNNLSVFAFTISNLNISRTNTGVRISYSPITQFPKPGNRVTLEFSSEVNVTYSGSFSVFSQSSTQITLSGVTTNSILGWSVTTPPSTRSFTFKFTTYQISTTNTNPYAVQTRSITYTCVSGVIVNASATPTNSLVNAVTVYTIVFTIPNRLQATSFINVQLPTQLAIQTGNASCAMAGHSCSVRSASNISVTVGSAITANSVLTITINGVKNSNQALTTSSFAIFTYYDSLYDSLVDKIESGITATMTPNSLTTGAITPSSYTTYAIGTYKIDLTLMDYIPAGGYMLVEFPATVVPQSAQLIAASFGISTCSASLISVNSTNSINITGCFSADMTNLAFSLNLSNIRNPISFRPSATFKVYTRGPTGSLINFMDSGLTVTMNVAATTTSFSVTPSSLVVGEISSYSFQVTHAITPHSTGDYLIITTPALMSVPGTPSCLAQAGITSISCVALSSNQLKITYASSPAMSVQASVSGITNYLVGDQTVNYALAIFDSGDYKMEEYLVQGVTYSESTLTSVTTNNDSNIAVGELSNITLTISNSLALYASLNRSLTQLDITIPPQFTIGTVCTTTSGTCSVSSSKYRVTNIGLTLTNVNVVMPNVLLNYYNPTSTSFALVYTYNGFNVSVKNSGVVLSRYCTSPCQRCSTSVTTCESCLPAPNTLIYHDSQTKTCASACVPGKYADSNNQCQPCVSPCSTCLDSQNCTACVPNMWLYQYSCVAICPSTYYNNSNGRCTSCQSPCRQCTALNSCINCATGYFTNNWCVNASSCPNGTYANSTTMACEPCESPCLTCSSSQTTCTTCRNGYLYYSNICVQNCPSGMYQSSIYCFNCVAPCATCTSSSSCTTCISNYLNPATNTCVDGNNCPTGTYPNATTMQCNTCPTGCTTCTNSTNCTSCNTNIYVFYNYACLINCPSGTYKSGVVCLPCTAPCSTCRTTDTTCTSCIPPKLYFNNTCLDICPDTTYNNNGTCSSCLRTCATCSAASSCDTCVTPLYFQNNQCVYQCPAGTFGDVNTRTCISCVSPCSSCQTSGSNCTQCIAPQVEYQNGCVNNCPTAYFVVSGSCRTCPNCLNCLDATTCLQCKPGFYEYNGACYVSCPTAAPILDDVTNTCGKCDETCRTCQSTAKNCTSCFSVTYLYKGSCLTQCPSSFIQDQVSGTCKQPLIGNIIYFPFTFLFVFFLIVCIASKCLYPQSENITTLGGIVSLSQFGSWCVLTYIVTIDFNLSVSIISAVKYVGLVCVLLSVGVGAAFVIAVYKSYEWDKGILAWKEYDSTCVYAYRIVNALSFCTFRFFRFLYCRFFNRTFFTMYVADGERFITTTNRLTFVTLFTNSLPMIGVCAYVLYKKQIYDQTFFCALDTLILGLIAAIILTIDSCKSKDHFDSIKDGLPFLKYKNMGNDDSLISQALLSRNLQNRIPAKSEVDPKEKDNLFKKINWLPNLNKFGHLNVLEETPNDKDEILSLPQYDKLGDYEQYDPNRMSEDDRVVDEDLYFLKQQEERRKREQLQQEERRQQERRRLKKLQEEEEQRKREQEQRRKRQLMEQDERQRVQLQFPDLAAIDKVENKNGKNRKNPLDLLSNCKKVDEKPIDDKAMKKLEEIGKKNGIDPNFMKQTFGVQKNHNPELLNQIIDKHNHVKRESVKQLFSQNNNPELLQELFGKNSKMDPKKLRQMLNDPDSAILIKKLADKEEGIVSAQMAKQLFEQNGKYTKEFTKNLLSDNNGMDPQKLKTLLKDSKATGKDSPLKALKKIGGENLQNTTLLNNMLGEESTLNPQNFTRVANDLSIKAIQNLFTNKSKNSDIITSKILNNKKINLKNIVPILEDQQLLQQLAEALGSDDPNLEQNLINLFKNAENIDPVKLKQMLSDPIIRQKLLSKPVDPDFLATILNKDSKSDLKILSDALKEMPDQLIEQTFKFDLQRNTDFKNLAELFDKNSKTDPVLVAKMLDPDMVKKLYVKGNDTKMLNKLVEKGNQFDPQVIKNVYGDQRNNIFDTRTDNLNNMNLINFDDDKGEQFRSQKQYSLGFQKNNKNQINMSRTAGGVLSFLTPIVPINNNKNYSKEKRQKGFNQSNQDGWTSHGQYEQQQQEYDDDGEVRVADEEEGHGKGTRKKKAKRTKKKLTDIRHPAEEIYLQRIQAPHQHAVRKASIRKKKKKVQNPGVMDEDNDIFDMDF